MAEKHSLVIPLNQTKGKAQLYIMLTEPGKT